MLSRCSCRQDPYIHFLARSLTLRSFRGKMFPIYLFPRNNLRGVQIHSFPLAVNCHQQLFPGVEAGIRRKWPVTVVRGRRQWSALAWNRRAGREIAWKWYENGQEECLGKRSAVATNEKKIWALQEHIPSGYIMKLKRILRLQAKTIVTSRHLSLGCEKVCAYIGKSLF